MGSYAGIHAEGDLTLARAWPRFWARLADIGLYGFILSFCAGLTFPATVNALLTMPGGAFLFGMVMLPLILVLEAAVVSQTGFSPGKWLAGIHLQTTEGGRPSLEAALRRNLMVWTRGLWLGLPILALIGYVNGYNDVQGGGLTSWDEASDTRIADVDSNVFRTILAAALAVGLNVVDRMLQQG
jgi:uncharacterized RDD family membrane protein YckC